MFEFAATLCLMVLQPGGQVLPACSRAHFLTNDCIQSLRLIQDHAPEGAEVVDITCINVDEKSEPKKKLREGELKS